MNEQDFISQVQLAIEKKTNGTLAPTQAVEAIIPRTLYRFAVEVMGRENRARLEKAFTATMVSGKASLASLADLLIESVPDAYITHPQIENPLQYQANRRDLDYPPSEEFVYFTVIENAIVARDGKNPAVAPPDDTITILAARIPTMADIPTPLEPALVALGVEVFLNDPTLQEA